MAKHDRTYKGRHWETGTLANILDAQGIVGPHTGKPPTEALLMGISGGANFGYFTFAYPGYLPFGVLLTRNTFDPLDELYQRLAWPHEVVGTPDSDKGLKNLQKALDEGYAPMIIADIHLLPYYGIEQDPMNWAPLPMMVADIEGDTAWVVDRSQCAWPVPLEALSKARGRIKDLKNKVIRFESPDWNQLSQAVKAGIRQSISLFTEDPPKGAKDRFGFLGFAFWGELLTNQRNKQSWERYFGNEYGHYHALAGSKVQPGLWSWIMTAGSGDGAEREVYADFLEEASTILDHPALKDVAKIFRKSAASWRELAWTMLPDTIPSFAETRKLRTERSKLWVEQGPNGLDQVRAIDTKLSDLMSGLKEEFPLSADEVRQHRAQIAESLAKVAGIEREAISALQEAMR